MPSHPYLDHLPRLGDAVAMADDAYVVGDVTIAGPAVLDVSAVLRGDQSAITIGPRVRIGRGTTVHVERWRQTHLRGDIWVGDGAVVHACVAGEGVRVEDGALLLSGSEVGAGSIVAAGSLVPEGARFPENSYLIGTPARRQRDTTEQERAETLRWIAEAMPRTSTNG